MTPAESALYSAVEDFIGDAYRAASPEKRSAVGFVMTVYRRRLASSFEALKRTLNGRLMRAGGITEEDASQDETSDEVMSGQEVAFLVADAPELDTINERDRINDLLRRIAQLGTDSKARRLKIELDLGGHFKTGHRGSLQNRPTEHHPGRTCFTLSAGLFGKSSLNHQSRHSAEPDSSLHLPSPGR